MPRPKRRASPVKCQAVRLLIVEARYYEDIADRLLAGATTALEQVGAQYDVVTVPGALEIPAAIVIAADNAARAGEPYDGAVALGCVIRGETFHFEIVSMQSARGLMDLSVAHGFPVGNGILTVENEKQAKARTGGRQGAKGHGDKGAEAARAALALIALKHMSAA